PRPGVAREGGAPFAAHHPAHGGERGRDPRQRRVADEADWRARARRHRAHQRRRGKRKRRPRGAAESACAARETLAVLGALLICVAVLLATGVAGIALAARREGTAAIYGVSLAASAVALLVALGA